MTPPRLTVDSEAEPLDPREAQAEFVVQSADLSAGAELAPPPPVGASRWKQIGSRVVYWCPVLVPMVLFAQISFLGLRPALCESRRLAAAETTLHARHDRDVQLAVEIFAHWRARQDPIFLERQRRLRERAPLVAERR